MNGVNQAKNLSPDELRRRKRIRTELRLIRLLLMLGSLLVSITVALILGRKIGLITLAVTSLGLLLVGVMVERSASVAVRKTLRRIMKLVKKSWN
jgi:hypothetical protein